MAESHQNPVLLSLAWRWFESLTPQPFCELMSFLESHEPGPVSHACFIKGEGLAGLAT